MKTIAKSKKLAPKSRRVVQASAARKLSDEEFRRQLHLELANEIQVARKDAQQRFGHLLRPRTDAELKVRSAAVRAMFVKWEEESRRNPVSAEESASYDRMLERMRRERAS